MAEDYKPKSSVHELERFIESTVYTDFINEIDVRIEDLRDVLESADNKLVHSAQGAIKLAREFKDIFECIVENKKADLREEADDKEDK